MSLDDQCMCSRTCKRLQELCGNHFRRKYPNKVNAEVKIRIVNGGRLRVYPFENYVKCFYNFVKNVTIIHYKFQEKKSKNKQSKIASIVNFVNTKCDQNLHKISINGDVNFEWTALCEKIENFLRSVEIVQFAHRSHQGHDATMAMFLKYCPNIRRLILCGVSFEGNIDAILQQPYQQLTHFFYIKGSPIKINAEKLKTFFKMNDKIQCVAWNFVYYDTNKDMANIHAVQCIEAHDYALNLEHLLLSIGPSNSYSFEIICGQLKVLCDRDRFKTLELEFIHEEGANALKSDANQLAVLKQVTKIHLRNIKLTDVIPALQSLSYLKFIVLSDMFPETNWDSWSDLEELNDLVDSTLDMALPQIVEVQIEYMHNESELTSYIMQFARHWMNLERMSVPSHNSYTYDLTFPIDELNRARGKLKNALGLTIFTNHEGNVTNLDHKLVKLKFVEFERCFDSNPFQDYCMKV